jgi:hypothetical protein
MICEVCGEDKVCLSTCGECDLKTFENIKKQGAIKELGYILDWVCDRDIEEDSEQIIEVENMLRKRLKELKERGV